MDRWTDRWREWNQYTPADNFLVVWDGLIDGQTDGWSESNIPPNNFLIVRGDDKINDMILKEVPNLFYAPFFRH